VSSSSSLAAAADSKIPTTILDVPSEEQSYTHTSRDMQQVITTIELAARKAGVIMQKTSGKIAVQKTKMNTSDLVTASDIECQRVIQETIQSCFPKDDFLGEEDVDAGSLASSSALKSAIAKSDGDSDSNSVGKDEEGGKLLFIVDPIDGTTNFQAGLPMFCVSIGVVSLENEDNEPVVVAGVIYNPILNEMVSAVKSRGCYMNGKRLESKIGPSELNQALINVGFPVTSAATLKASSTAVAALATSVRGLRMIASASQVMSWVAQGKLSAYVSWDLNAWDVAAGMVIVEESGGFVSNFEGGRADISTRDMIVTCNEADGERKLTQEIRKILNDSGCLEY
jgi:myo-inositol-1(or 4)-monophosphatase